MPLQERCSESLLVHPLLASFRLVGAVSGVWWRVFCPPVAAALVDPCISCSEEELLLSEELFFGSLGTGSLEHRSRRRKSSSRACGMHQKTNPSKTHKSLSVSEVLLFGSGGFWSPQSLGRLLTHQRTFQKLKCVNKVLGRDIFQLVSASAQRSGCRALVCRRPVDTQVPGHAVRARPFIFHSLQL